MITVMTNYHIIIITAYSQLRSTWNVEFTDPASFTTIHENSPLSVAVVLKFSMAIPVWLLNETATFSVLDKLTLSFVQNTLGGGIP